MQASYSKNEAARPVKRARGGGGGDWQPISDHRSIHLSAAYVNTARLLRKHRTAIDLVFEVYGTFHYLLSNIVALSKL